MLVVPIGSVSLFLYLLILCKLRLFTSLSIVDSPPLHFHGLLLLGCASWCCLWLGGLGHGRGTAHGAIWLIIPRLLALYMGYQSLSRWYYGRLRLWCWQSWTPSSCFCSFPPRTLIVGSWYILWTCHFPSGPSSEYLCQSSPRGRGHSLHRIAVNWLFHLQLGLSARLQLTDIGSCQRVQ